MFISELKFKRQVQLDLKGSAVNGYDFELQKYYYYLLSEELKYTYILIDSIYILDDYISKPNAYFSQKIEKN